MMNHLRIFVLGILYFIVLILFAILVTPFLGVIAGFLGAFQKLFRSIKNDLVRVKYHPMQVAKRRFDDAYYNARSTGDTYSVKEQFRINPLSFTKLTSHFIATFLIFIALLPFLVLYGIGKAPYRTMSYGIRFWKSHFLHYSAQRIYKNWGVVHDATNLH
jgi:hypothetical protein